MYKKPIFQTNVAGNFASVTSLYAMEKGDTLTKQYTDLSTTLAQKELQVEQNLTKQLQINLDYTDMRSKGVDLAWQYEQAELQLGGSGSVDWSKEQQQQIFDSGKVSGAEGHHINNVANYNHLQANPDNIVFAKTRAEHLAMHNGDFANSTSGQLIDRQERLDNVYEVSYAKQEVASLGTIAALGLGASLSFSVIAILARQNMSWQSVSQQLPNSLKTGIEISVLSSTVHMTSRFIGYATNHVNDGILPLYDGLLYADALTRITVTGTISIMLVNSYLIYKMKRKSMNNLQMRTMLMRNVALSFATLSFSVFGTALFGSMGALVGIMAMFGAYSLRKYWRQEETRKWKILQQQKVEQLYEKVYFEVRSI